MPDFIMKKKKKKKKQIQGPSHKHLHLRLKQIFFFQNLNGDKNMLFSKHSSKFFNPIALKTVKTPQGSGRSECNRVNQMYFISIFFHQTKHFSITNHSRASTLEQPSQLTALNLRFSQGLHKLPKR